MHLSIAHIHTIKVAGAAWFGHIIYIQTGPLTKCVAFKYTDLLGSSVFISKSARTSPFFCVNVKRQTTNRNFKVMVSWCSSFISEALFYVNKHGSLAGYQPSATSFKSPISSRSQQTGIFKAYILVYVYAYIYICKIQIHFFILIT